MTGSGTCRDVCQDLGIDCWSGDIHAGFDLCDPRHFHGEAKLFDPETFDFVWIHPPYWRMKLYADEPRDLSRAPTLDAFLERYRLALAHCVHVLKPGGKLAVLVGDYTDPEEGFLPLTYWTKHLAFDLGLRQCCTDIVRFSHGASSSRKVYRSSFIPGLHDTLAIFENPSHDRPGGSPRPGDWPGLWKGDKDSECLTVPGRSAIVRPMTKRQPPKGDTQPDLFVAAFADIPIRDQKDTMERPFFSLAKKPRPHPDRVPSRRRPG
jgi:SAM-dependent methyltransferase